MSRKSQETSMAVDALRNSWGDLMRGIGEKAKENVLESLEQPFVDATLKIKDIANTYSPRTAIKRHPFLSVLGGLTTGVLVGSNARRILKFAKPASAIALNIALVMIDIELQKVKESHNK